MKTKELDEPCGSGDAQFPDVLNELPTYPHEFFFLLHKLMGDLPPMGWRGEKLALLTGAKGFVNKLNA